MSTFVGTGGERRAGRVAGCCGELGHVRQRCECECTRFELCCPGIEGLDDGGQEEWRKGCAKGRTR